MSARNVGDMDRKPRAEREDRSVSPALELRNLEVGLGAFRLGPVTLTLVSGDYLVVLGPSGCGKTTLLKAVAGFYPVAPEALLLGGEAAGSLAPHLRRVGYVSQNADLFPHLSVAGNVRFGLRYLDLSASEKRARFERIVGLLGLEGLLGREPATLSGGEGRRAALARALAVEPRVLLLDEPLGMIDESARPAMLATLRTLHRELGTATIHVTHDREEAGAVGSHAAVMRAGRIEQLGTVEELFRQPAVGFVAEFLARPGYCARREE